MFRWTTANVLWLILYLAAMTSVVVGLRHYRLKALSIYGTPQASANWMQWRSDAEVMSRTGARRAPKSLEPPSLVLMRDHFAACLGISLLLSTCLFVWMMVCVRGAVRLSPRTRDDPSENDLRESHSPDRQRR